MVRQYGILGWPVAHSLSPLMQEAAFRHCGLPARYERIAVREAELAECVGRLRREGWSGWNVTVPHKEAIVALLDEVAPEALALRSVNTVANRDGRLVGCSTDGHGLAMALGEAFGIALPGLRIVFVGAGGAVRAVAGHLAKLGVAEMRFLNRTRDRAETLAADVRKLGQPCQTAAFSLDDPAALEGIDLVVQGTSLGLHDDDPLPIDPGAIPLQVPVFDMIYRETPLLKAVRHRGGRAADGAGMLLHQGALAFEFWTGRPAPLEVMRAALEEARRQAAAR